MKNMLIIAACAVALVWLSVSPRSTVAAGEEDNQVKEILGRLDHLERAVLSDPTHPKSTLSSRVDAIEESIKDLQKQDADGKKSDVKEDDALRKKLAEMEKESDELSRRVKALEERLHKTNVDTAVR